VLDCNEILRKFAKGHIFKCIRALTCCSTMVFRNMFTSDIQYDSEVSLRIVLFSIVNTFCKSLPRDMYLPVTGGRTWEEIYDWMWFPEKPKGNTQDEMFKSLTPNVPNGTYSVRLQCWSTYMFCILAVTRTPRQQNDSILFASPNTTARSLFTPRKQDKLQPPQLLPDPLLSFTQVIGYSPSFSHSVIWSNNMANKSCVFYSCFKTIIMMDIVKRAQRTFVGHSENISCFCGNGKGTILASAQQGKNPLIRVWDIASGNCIAIIQGFESDICSITLADNGLALAAVGRDKHAKQQIILWDLSQVHKSGKVSVVVKQTCDFHVAALKFMPYEDAKLVSCGEGNIRFWRIKSGILRGCSAKLEAETSFLKKNYLDLSVERSFPGTVSSIFCIVALTNYL